MHQSLDQVEVLIGIVLGAQLALMVVAAGVLEQLWDSATHPTDEHRSF